MHKYIKASLTIEGICLYVMALKSKYGVGTVSFKILTSVRAFEERQKWNQGKHFSHLTGRFGSL